MDLDRLNLEQIRMVSDVVKLLGVPADTQGLRDCVAMLEALASKYRETLATMSQTERNHA